MKLRVPVRLALLGGALLQAHGSVLINEIFYNAPNDIQGLQWIELHNDSDQPTDLSGWRIGQGIDFALPAGTSISAFGYLVLASQSDVFKEHYGTPPDAGFPGALSRKSMRLELLDRDGKKVDAIRYKDEPPWPAGADGYSGSLERICPSAPGERPENWASSPLGEEMKPGGTPGKRNSSFSAVLPPVISKVRFSPGIPAPGQPITVEAEVKDPAGVREVTCRYRVAGTASAPEELTVPMSRRDDGRFVATLPGQKSNQVVRFRVHAVNEKQAQRSWPGENEPRPALSVFVQEKLENAQIPSVLILNFDAEQAKAIERHLQAPNQRGMPSEEEQLRRVTRMQLQSGSDLAPLWFEFAAGPPLTQDQLVSLRTVFTNQLTARDELVRATVDSPNLKERVGSVPELVKSFHTKVSDAVRPVLSEVQNSRIVEVQQTLIKTTAPGGLRFTPERLLKRLLDLEGLFFRLSTQPDISAAQFQRLAASFQAASARRLELTNAAQALMQGQGDFEDLRDKVDKVKQDLNATVKPILNRDQQQTWARLQDESDGFMPGQGRAKPPRQPVGTSALAYYDPRTKETVLHDFIAINERNSGLNVRFHKDRLFQGMSTCNILFESEDRFVLAEPLAYELYRRAGVPCPIADYARLTVDGKPLGYYELIEQPNRSFLERIQRTGDGNLYKILWYGRGVVGQHEKKTNRHSGHEDIIELVEQLEKAQSKPDEQWALIQQRFNVQEVVNYFAANTCLSHWDGFFNNYFTYHEAGPNGRWEMYPWDQDKTWGFYDGLPPGEVFFDMPITFGMEGDRPPGWPADRPLPRGFGMGPNWWRPGGYFSKPLLANPHFRKLYLARTKELCESIYTEEAFFPLIDAVGSRLAEEVRFRAQLLNRDPDQAAAELGQHLKSLKDHLSKRRQFLLEQSEVRASR